MAWTERYMSATGGGAHDGTTAADAWDLDEAIANVAAGHRVNVLAGSGNSYSVTTTSKTFATAGTTNSRIWWRGYKSTIGDLDSRPTSQRVVGTDIASLVGTTGKFTVSGAYQIFSNISFDSAATTPTVEATGLQGRFVRCRFDNTNSSEALECDGSNNQAMILDCLIERSSGTGNCCLHRVDDGIYVGCKFVGGAIGLELPVNNMRCNVYRCVFEDQTDHTIQITNNFTGTIALCTFYNATNSILDLGNATQNIHLIENYFHTSGGYAIDHFTGTSANVNIVGNGFYDSSYTSGRLNNIYESLQWFSQNDSSDQFNDAASEDYSLKSTSNSASVQNLIEGDGPSTYPDNGAMQREVTAGGSASGARNPLSGPIG